MFRASHPSRRSRQAAFTLVELLTVMVIIIILLSITISVQRGITAKQNNTKAKAEIQAIGVALDRFKAQYGDYPPAVVGSTDSEDNLILALTGRARWEHATDAKTGVTAATFPGANSISMPTSTSTTQTIPYKPFLDVAQFTIGTDSTHTNPVLIDPWGNAYLYRYKTLTDAIQPNPANRTWKAIGYALVSRGADQAPGTDSQIFPEGMETSGVVPNDYFDTGSNPGNADNIVNWVQD
jgi:type II secretory pathway pseudopilin PulG